MAGSPLAPTSSLSSSERSGSRSSSRPPNVLIGVIATDGDRVRRFEYFDVGDEDRALARLAELGSEPVASAM